MIRNRRASNQNDLIYGLLGMIREPVRRVIDVDYTLPLPAVFVQAAYAAVMELPMTLPHMWETFSNTMTTNPELPSWCPDYGDRGYLTAGINLPMVSALVRGKLDSYGKAIYADAAPTLSFDAWRLDTVLNSGGRIDRSVANTLTSTQVNQEDFPADLVGRTFREIVELSRWLHVFDNTFPWELSEDSIAKLQRILKFVVSMNPQIPGQGPTFYGKIVQLCHLTTVSRIETMRQINETLSTNLDNFHLM